jgi:adenosine 3'-phospho 5'-phosphosulfate transporter B3
MSAIASSVLQENVFRTGAKEHPAIVSSIIVLSYFILASGHMIFSREYRKSPWKYYLLLSVLSFGGTFLTNLAIQHMDYATRVVFKSAKVLPVMTFSICMLGKRYSPQQWLSALFLVLGIVLFSVGDSLSDISFTIFGIPIILSAVCVDAFTGNFEEKFFFKRANPCSVQDVICHSSLFGIFHGVLSIFVSKDRFTGISFFSAHPVLVCKIFCFSVLGYISLVMILTIIANFGATEAEVVKCVRRLLSVCASFLFFEKQLNRMYFAGFLSVLLSTIVQLNSRRC